MIDEQVAAQIETVLRETDELCRRGDHGQAAVRLAAAIGRLAPTPSPYRDQAAQVLEYGGLGEYQADSYREILQALRDDVRSGYTQQLEETVREHVFDDLLDLAADLNESHAPSAAVLVGAVLEEHLRKLSQKHSLKVDAFEQMGIQLVKANVIKEIERKNLVAWYGQRTAGAHGRFDEVVAEDVPRHIEGARGFIARYPA